MKGGILTKRSNQFSRVNQHSSVLVDDKYFEDFFVVFE